MAADKETAAHYSMMALDFVSNEYHRVGGQPVLETDRIDDFTEREVNIAPSLNFISNHLSSLGITSFGFSLIYLIDE